MRTLLLTTALLSACSTKDPPDGTDSGTSEDVDGDGWDAGEDCDDTDAAVHPGAAELCDGVDNDCSGEIDDNAEDAATFYLDSDGDGHGSAANPVVACAAPEGTAAAAGDCNDDDALVHPEAEELCDTVDNNCDGAVDEGLTSTFYADGDSDGHGDPGATVVACEAPAGHVAVGGDCDDADGETYPGAPEQCGDGVRNDCDGGGEPFETCGLAGEVSLASTVALLGETEGDHAGGRVSDAGDVNGDGLADVMVSAQDADGGRVYLVLGSIPGETSLASAHAVLLGESDNDHAGGALSAAGDVDGDGYDDLLIGALADDNAGEGSGSAYVVLGGVTGTRNLSSAHAHLIGEGHDEYAGCAVSGAGDVNDDGLADLIIGAFRNDEGGHQAGSAYLVLGGLSGTHSLSTAHAKLMGEAAEDFAGQAVAGVGDVDGDGLGDVLVGAWGGDGGGSSSGGAYLVVGGASGTVSLASAHAHLVGETSYDRAGHAVAAAGDVDGDGLDDLLIGAPGEETGGSYAGSAYVVLGGVSGTVSLSSAHAKVSGEAPDDDAGYALDGAGDVDGDGLGDLLIGARGSDAGGNYAGAAYLVLGGLSGSSSLSTAQARLTGTESGQAAGHSVSAAGDTDGDGLGDLLVGAPQQYSTTTAGLAYLVPSVAY